MWLVENPVTDYAWWGQQRLRFFFSNKNTDFVVEGSLGIRAVGNGVPPPFINFGTEAKPSLLKDIELLLATILQDLRSSYGPG